MGCGSGWSSFCGSGGKEQDEARWPFLRHLKQSPFMEQFSHFLEESLEIWGFKLWDVSGTTFLVVRGVWEKSGQSFFWCPVCQHLRQSFSLMQHSHSSRVSLRIEG